MRLLKNLDIHNHNDLKKLFMQFIKFGLVGVSNTAINYGIEMLGYYVLFANWADSFLLVILRALLSSGE